MEGQSQAQHHVIQLIVNAIAGMGSKKLEHVCRLDVHVNSGVYYVVVRVNNSIRDLVLDAKPNRYPIELFNSTLDIWNSLRDLTHLGLGFTELNTIIQNGGLDSPHVEVKQSRPSDELQGLVETGFVELSHPILQQSLTTSLHVPPSNFWRVIQDNESPSALDPWGRVLERYLLAADGRIMVFHVPLTVSVGHLGQLAAVNVGWNLLPLNPTLADFEWFTAIINNATQLHVF
ncbi:MAG TPA: hypothetical protein VLG40_03845 [Candidatus Saccharimonas sp.]|nr:hypothetical protein [Candidatus Saccharimonas sp.]